MNLNLACLIKEQKTQKFNWKNVLACLIEKMQKFTNPEPKHSTSVPVQYMSSDVSI